LGPSQEGTFSQDEGWFYPCKTKKSAQPTSLHALSAHACDASDTSSKHERSPIEGSGMSEGQGGDGKERGGQWPHRAAR